MDPTIHSFPSIINIADRDELSGKQLQRLISTGNILRSPNDTKICICQMHIQFFPIIRDTQLLFCEVSLYPQGYEIESSLLNQAAGKRCFDEKVAPADILMFDVQELMHE